MLERNEEVLNSSLLILLRWKLFQQLRCLGRRLTQPSRITSWSRAVLRKEWRSSWVIPSLRISADHHGRNLPWPGAYWLSPQVPSEFDSWCFTPISGTLGTRFVRTSLNKNRSKLLWVKLFENLILKIVYTRCLILSRTFDRFYHFLFIN